MEPGTLNGEKDENALLQDPTFSLAPLSFPGEFEENVNCLAI
jgi:hypothetical protein